MHRGGFRRRDKWLPFWKLLGKEWHKRCHKHWRRPVCASRIGRRWLWAGMLFDSKAHTFFPHSNTFNLEWLYFHLLTERSLLTLLTLRFYPLTQAIAFPPCRRSPLPLDRPRFRRNYNRYIIKADSMCIDGCHVLPKIIRYSGPFR